MSDKKIYECFQEPGLPTTPVARKQTPIATGVLRYFPDAIAEVAKVSFVGNEQHNPGQPLHWARGKSTDQLDAASRHITDYLMGVSRDEKGNHVLAQAAWRILAELQLDVEKEVMSMCELGLMPWQHKDEVK